MKIPTPYGGRYTYTLPHGTTLYVHVKDKQKIRHKKRWSQCMYMYYLLGFNNMGLSVPTAVAADIAKNTFILTLDGDIEFKPHAVDLLMRMMSADDQLGAACGRIHPVGFGLLACYQGRIL